MQTDLNRLLAEGNTSSIIERIRDVQPAQQMEMAISLFANMLEDSKLEELSELVETLTEAGIQNVAAWASQAIADEAVSRFVVVTASDTFLNINSTVDLIAGARELGLLDDETHQGLLVELSASLGDLFLPYINEGLFNFIAEKLAAVGDEQLLPESMIADLKEKIVKLSNARAREVARSKPIDSAKLKRYRENPLLTAEEKDTLEAELLQIVKA